MSRPTKPPVKPPIKPPVSRQLRPPARRPRAGRTAVIEASTIVETLRVLIAGRAGHPCPDNRLLAEALSVHPRVVRDAIDLLVGRLELDVERTAWVGGLRRRMRVKVQDRWRNWTDYSRRGAYDLRITAPDLQRLSGINGCAHHLLRVLLCGRFE